MASDTGSWLVTVDYRGRRGDAELAVDDDRLATCAEILAEHMGAATTDGSVYSVAVMVEATTPGAALDAAADLIEPAIEGSHLPVWRRVRVEVIAEDEVRRSRVE
jgi:hypothetical protein